MISITQISYQQTKHQESRTKFISGYRSEQMNRRDESACKGTFHTGWMTLVKFL